MKDVEKELFDLLRFSLWSRSDSSLQKYTGEEGTVAEWLRDCQWKSLLELSKEQCVFGILADVLATFKGNVEVSRDVLLNWIGLVMKLEQRNIKMNRMVISLSENEKLRLASCADERAGLCAKLSEPSAQGMW